jgi:hypothetical protein
VSVGSSPQAIGVCPFDEGRRGLAPLRGEPRTQQIETLSGDISLCAPIDSLQEHLHVVYLAQQLRLGRQVPGVLQQPVGRSQVLGDHAVVIEPQRCTCPG